MPFPFRFNFRFDRGVLMALSDAEQRELLTKVRAVFDIVADNQVQLRGPGLSGWPQLGREPAGNRTLVDAFAAVMKKLSA